MRIKVSEFRNIIRKVLNETPLEDVYPLKSQKNTRTNFDNIKPGYEEKAIERQKEEIKNNEPKVHKFFSGKKFRDDAVKLYKNLSVAIYVVPVYTTSNYLSSIDFPRSKFLEQSDLSDDKKSELKNALEKGAAVFMPRADELNSGFLPTPWMIIHALFDDNSPDASFLLGTATEVRSCLAAISDSRIRFNKILTMKSARDGKIQTLDDAVAEIMCQAILTTNGFQYNKTGFADADNELSKIAEITKNSRTEFETKIRGKIIQIDVTTN